MARTMQVIWVQQKAEYFFDDDWTGRIALIGKENFDFTRNAQ